MSGKSIQSPSYPSLSLAEAIDRVKKIEQIYRSSALDREDAAKILGYSSLSGPANKALAALASYELVERAGKGMVRVTPLARAILYPESEAERSESIRRAAMGPPLFKEIRQQFHDLPVPPEGGVITYLNRRGFNPSAVPRAAKAFLATAEMIEQLAAFDSHGANGEGGEESGVPAEKFGAAAVGDLVQWESQGVLQFETPRRVRWVSDDGTHLAVEGSDTGIPMSQVIVETAAPKEPPLQSPPPEPGGVGIKGQRKAVFPVSEGDVIFLFPEGLTKEGLEELEQYLNVFLKKEKKKTNGS